jgi:hypothetical protein
MTSLSDPVPASPTRLCTRIDSFSAHPQNVPAFPLHPLNTGDLPAEDDRFLSLFFSSKKHCPVFYEASRKCLSPERPARPQTAPVLSPDWSQKRPGLRRPVRCLPGGHPRADHFGGSGRGRFERTADVESEITFRPIDAIRARLMTAGCAEAFLEVRDPAESRHAHLHC